MQQTISNFSSSHRVQSKKKEISEFRTTQKYESCDCGRFVTWCCLCSLVRNFHFEFNISDVYSHNVHQVSCVNFAHHFELRFLKFNDCYILNTFIVFFQGFNNNITINLIKPLFIYKLLKYFKRDPLIK